MDFDEFVQATPGFLEPEPEMIDSTPEEEDEANEFQEALDLLQGAATMMAELADFKLTPRLTVMDRCDLYDYWKSIVEYLDDIQPEVIEGI